MSTADFAQQGAPFLSDRYWSPAKKNRHGWGPIGEAEDQKWAAFVNKKIWTTMCDEPERGQRQYTSGQSPYVNFLPNGYSKWVCPLQRARLGHTPAPQQCWESLIKHYQLRLKQTNTGKEMTPAGLSSVNASSHTA